MTDRINVDYYVDMNKEDLTEEVVKELRQRILRFALLPGVRISDQEVAAELGLSRTPVRQALFKLAEKGLIEARHNRGFRVRIFSMEDVKDLYFFREGLERMAVNRAAANMTGERAGVLREHLAAYPEVIRAGELIPINRLDSAFHQLIADFSESPLLKRTIGNLQDQLQIVRRYQHLAPRSFKETHNEHSRIAGHLIHNRPVRAVKAMSSHILDSMEVVLRMLKQIQGEET